MLDIKPFLDDALARGIIDNAQRVQLAAMADEEKGDTQERIKPVGTFNEIFVTFGVMLLLRAFTGLSFLILHNEASAQLISAALAWLAALHFDQGKRFRLPVIYGALSAACSLGYAMAYISPGDIRHLFANDTPLNVVLAPLIIALIALATGAWRFRIPFLMLPIGILLTVIVTYAARHVSNDAPLRLLLGACGLSILAVAVHFDMKDPERIKRWSDYAFWSYIVGSPLFVHSLFLSMLLRDKSEWAESFVAWGLTLVLVAAVSFIGLLLNRRAFILSTLIYVAFVVGRVFVVFGSAPVILFVTLLILGIYVTALGSHWARVRSHVMKKLPYKSWMKDLPAF